MIASDIFLAPVDFKKLIRSFVLSAAAELARRLIARTGSDILAAQMLPRLDVLDHESCL